MTAAVVSCQSDDQTITHSTDRSEGLSGNRTAHRLDLHLQGDADLVTVKICYDF